MKTYQDIFESIVALLDAPVTDDPVDILKLIAAECEYPGEYTYFDNKGQWVRYPIEGE